VVFLSPVADLPSPLAASPSDLSRAAALLRAGEIVALPTETVYGLAADALNPAALAKVFAAKGRPLVDPLIVHVADLAQLATVAQPDPRLAALAPFWPGPLTVVLRRLPVVPDLVTAGLDTVAVRIPSHPVFREILSRVGPLAAPSANPFGYVSPTLASHVRDSLGERCPWIVDGGPCAHGVESTILDLSQPGSARLLRPGPVTREALAVALGAPIETVARAAPSDQAQLAPGMLDRHYSPRTPIRLFARGAEPDIPPAHAALLLQSRRASLPAGAEPFYLSESGEPAEAARALFALLRKLDHRGYEVIVAELADESGVGVALNDRLRRAAAR
jgi:L-threonylcarbamoyladenylate synthase